MPLSQGSGLTQPMKGTPEYDGVGVIIDTSNTCAVVSVNIDDCQREFCISKGIFYTFGVKCDGHINNILENGMEVNLSYKLSQNLNIYFVTAAWLGDKPDSLARTGTALNAVYGQKGHVSSLHGDALIVRCGSSQHNVIISKPLFYSEGYPLDEQSGSMIAVGTMVTFDAVPIKHNEIQHANPSEIDYNATCGWIGSKQPRFVDRFAFLAMEANEVQENEELALVELQDIFYGTVSVVASQVVAFADVEGINGKVMLFRSSFNRQGRPIEDEVAIGDAVCLRLHCGNVFPGHRQWFATQAWKDGGEIIADEKSSDGFIDEANKSGYYCDNIADVDNIADKKSSDGFIDEAKKSGYYFDNIADVDKIADEISGDGFIDEAKKSGYYCDNIADVEKARKVHMFEKDQLALWADEAKLACESKDIDSEIFETALEDSNSFPAKDEMTLSTPGEYIGSDIFKHSPEFTSSSPVLFDYPPLMGVITRLSFDSACILSHNLNIFAERDVVYINGNLCSVNEFIDLITPGELIVNFEAVLLNHQKNDSGNKNSKCTHHATCVWIGEKPWITDVINSSLSPPKFSTFQDLDRKFRGYVSRFCLPRIALVSLKKEKTTVCLHVSAFGGKPKPLHDYSSGEGCITSFVKLNDYIEFKVKDAGDVLEAYNVTFVKGKIKKPEKEDLSGTPTEHVLSAFDKFWPIKRRQFLLDFSGVLRSIHGYRDFVVECDVGRSSLLHSPSVYGFDDDKPIDLSTDRVLNGRDIRFDAELVESAGGYGPFHVKRMWTPGSNRPSAEILLMSKVSYKGSKTILRSKLYDGVIHSIPYHDSAVATLNASFVLVPLDSLVTSRKFNACYDTIDMFLKVGDRVRLKIEENRYRDHSGLKFLKAVECSDLKTFAIEGSEKDANVTQIKTEKSWDDAWGMGECYRTSTVEKNTHGRYTVSFMSSKRPGSTFKLDLFKTGSFFVDGVRTDWEKFDTLEGREVTFHVNHVRPKRLMEGNNSHGMMVACSWIGKEPSPFTVLKKKTVVPKGIISFHGQYECVVKSFPLPTHAFCKIGTVPVLVPLDRIEDDGVFVRADTELKTTQLVLLRVQEETVGEDTYLVGDNVKTHYMWNGIMVDVTGTIVSVPDPVGKIKIKGVDVEVCFEICHLYGFIRPKESAGARTLSKVESMRKKTKMGAKVRFTAFKTSGKTAPYRAIEVRLVKDSEDDRLEETPE